MAMSKREMDKLLGLSLGLENADGTAGAEDGAVGTVDEDGIPVEDSETAAAEVLETAEANEVVEADQTVAEDLQEAEVQLESYYSILRYASKNGGVSADGAAAITVGMESLTRKFRLPHARIFPSMESYGNANSRNNWTNITMEGVGTMLKSIWQKIKDQFNKIWASIKNWFLKVWDAAPRLKKKAEALKEKAGSVSGTQEKTYEAGFINKARINNKAPDKAAVLAACAEVENVAKVALGAAKVSKDDKGIEALLELMDVEKDIGGPEIATLLDRSMAGVESLGKTDKNDRYGDGRMAKHGAVIFGDKVFWISASNSSNMDSALETFRKLKIGYDNLESAPKDVTGTTFPSLGASDCESVCSLVIKSCDHIIDFKKQWQLRDSQHKQVITKADAAVKAAEKDGGDDDKNAKAKKVKDFAQSAIHVWSVCAKTDSSVIQTTIGAGNTALDMVAKSLAQYKKS